jgi:hypothetical protein
VGPIVNQHSKYVIRMCEKTNMVFAFRNFVILLVTSQLSGIMNTHISDMICTERRF